MNKNISRRELLSRGAELGLSTCLLILTGRAAAHSTPSQAKPSKPDQKASSKPEQGDTITEKVKDIVARELGVDRKKVLPDSRFVDDLGADSLDVVELIMAFEEAFDLEIPDEDAEKFCVVKDAIDYIKAHAHKRAPSSKPKKELLLRHGSLPH